MYLPGCKDISTELTEEEASAVLEPYVQVAREVYEDAAERLDLPAAAIRKIRFEVREDAHDTPRHFAGCAETGTLIVAAPEMVELPEDVVLALLLHEFGHALDFLFPGKFLLVRGELEVLPAVPKDLRDDPRVGQLLRARMKQWMHRGPDTVEVTADKVAELVSGRRIGYRGPCKLQHLDSGRPRPRGLR